MEIKLENFNYPADLNEQRRLFLECFPENAGTPVETIEHYEWKFKSFPSVKTAYEYVARIDNEMIGYYAAIPYEYTIHGNVFKVAMVCDVMTDIKARGKGVFTKLGVFSTDQFKKEDLAFSTGYPIRPEVIPGHRKAGWGIPFQIPMYGKFLKMDSFLNSRNKRILIPIANLFLKTYLSFCNIFSLKSRHIDIELYQSSQLESIIGLDDFFLELKLENKIALNKSIQFLKWRLTAPEKNYHIIVIRKEAKIVGYSVSRSVIKEGVPCMGILDFSLLDRAKRNAHSLLRQIEKIAITEKAELILMMMMRHRAKMYKILHHGFLKTPYPFSFIIKQFDESIDSQLLHNESSWNLMWIDSDDL